MRLKCRGPPPPETDLVVPVERRGIRGSRGYNGFSTRRRCRGLERRLHRLPRLALARGCHLGGGRTRCRRGSSARRRGGGGVGWSDMAEQKGR